MKTLLCLPVLILILFTGCSTVPPGYDADTTPGHNGAGWRPGPELQVQANNEQVTVGIDLLGIKNYEVRPWAKSPTGWMTPLRVLTYPLDYTGYMVEKHPWQSLVIAAATWEVTDNGISDLIDDIRGKEDKPKQAPIEFPSDLDVVRARFGEGEFNGSFRSYRPSTLQLTEDGVFFQQRPPAPPEE